MAENHDTGVSSNAPLLRSVDEEMGKSTTESGRRPKEPWKGEFVKSIVYAGLDAIVTSFSLISSISASHLSSWYIFCICQFDVLVLGFANLVADGISMGFGDFVSSSTERDVAAKERLVTQWEVTNHCGPQQLELLHPYQDQGMDVHDANMVVNVFAKYKDILVDEKMAAQKGMLTPDQAQKPWKNGLVTFAAFLMFGSAPLLSFIILIPFTNNEKHKFVGACILSALALALLGLAKAKIAGQKYAFSVAITLFNGVVAAAAAYIIGWTLRNVAGLQD
ncbi:hypothetical protein F0562_014825 [Nyssa sinensis]|uniref:Vacuolar iron transporter n=1 Tax=Nyssa sinensis TaxID=561372 RepID=A0A5J4ZRC0_9ASTE|nr:hypothetical protein F0562_014825 [Nyssa sinensis]